MNKKKLFMVDGAALFYRSYFAFIRNPLINSKGENTSAPYGFVNGIIRLLSEEKPDYLTVIFDTPEPTFRHQLYPEYKATREKMPDEMRQQFPRIIEFLNLLEINTMELEGYEADDIIGTIALKEVKEDIDIFMMTGDKDFMQLIRPGVSMYAQGKGGDSPEISGPEAVEAKFGCTPSQVIDVLGFMGDSSDNVPGVPKVGPKSAQLLISQFGSMENTYEHIDELKKSKMKENLIAFKEQAFLSKKLVTIHTEVPVSYNLSDFSIGSAKLENAESWFKEMEFSSLWRRLNQLEIAFSKTVIPESKAYDKKYTLVNDPDGFMVMKAQLKKFKHFAFDTETTGLSIQDDRLIGASFCAEPGQAWYVNLDEKKIDSSIRDELLLEIKNILEDENYGKIAQNAKFDIQVLRNEGIIVRPVIFDTMLAAYLLDSNDVHNMDHLAERYLNYKTTTFSELVEGDKKNTDPSMVDIQKLSDYAAEDADVTLRLFNILKPQIEEEKFNDLLYNVEIPLSLALAKMEFSGIKLDTRLLDDYSLELGKKLEELEKGLYQEAGKEFNLNSPSQLGPILFEEMEVHKTLGIKRTPRTKTGKYSTAENVLSKFEGHPFVDNILRYRKLTKLKSTYVDVLPRLVSERTKYLHTSFNQTVAATGRLSSSDPNLQNIPIRTDEGKKIRAAFIARDVDRKIISADYSQVELRIMAALSNDENMIDAFQKNEDIHRSTAAKVFHVEIEDVDSDMRRKAKEVNFGIIYGISQWGLARRLNITNLEAEEFIRAYFTIYPGVQRFMAETIADATARGFVTTILDRKRYLPELKSGNRQTYENGQRMAINSRIQGSAADLIKKAMIEIDRVLTTKNMNTKMLLQVHDELVFDVPQNEIDGLKTIVREKMEGALSLKVPLKVDIGIGDNWLEAH